MKAFWKLTESQREKLVKEFLDLHQSGTEPCKFTYEMTPRGVCFYSVHESAFYRIEQVVKFAEYYHASVYCSWDSENEKVKVYVS